MTIIDPIIAKWLEFGQEQELDANRLIARLEMLDCETVATL
jgi:hypothetical protein